MQTANWTTGRLAEDWGQQTGLHVTEETRRVSFRTHDSAGNRSTWPLRRKTEENTDDVGNALRGEVLFAGTTVLEPLFRIWVKLTWLMCCSAATR